MANHEIQVEMFYDGQWNAAPAYSRNGITLSRGAPGEGQDAPPSTAALTLDNRTGAYNPRNVTGPLYGSVGRNTPMRVRLGGLVHEDFEDATLAVTTSNSGSASWSRTSAHAYAGSWSMRSGVISNNQFSRLTVAVPTGIPEVSFWYRVSSEADFDFFTVLIDGVQVLQASGEVDWTHTRFPVAGATTIAFDYTKDPNTVGGDDAAYIDELTFGNVRSATEVASWAPAQAVKGDASTAVEGGGILRRLQQGRTPLRSAMYRAISRADVQPSYWWDLESGDGRALTSVPSALVGGPSLMAAPASAGLGNEDHRLSGVVGGTVVGPYGGSTAIDMSGGGQLSTTEMFTSAAGPFRFEVAVMFKEPVADTESGAVLRVRMGNALVNLFAGTTAGFETSLEISDDNTFDSLGNATVLDDGAWHHVRLDLTYASVNIDYDLTIDGSTVLSGTTAGVALGQINEVVLSPSGDVDAAAHLVFWDGAVPTNVDTYEAFTGHYGERAGVRFLRVLDEEGVSASIYGDDDDTQPMGPQRAQTLVDIVRDCVRTDDALLFEPRDDLALMMRTGRSRYNQDAALTLDFAGEQVAPGLVPVLDDQRTRNDVTAKRVMDGASARSIQETGPLNVQNPIDDPEGVGRYDTSVEVNPSLDVDPLAFASWHRAKGTVDEPRYPGLTVDLDAPGVPADLVAALDALEIGDRLEVENLPTDWQYGNAALLLLGVRENYPPGAGDYRRLVTLNTTPASAYEIGIVGANDGSTDLRGQAVDTDNSTLNAGVSATATTLSVASAGGTLWTTTAADWSTSLNGTCEWGGGLFLLVGGEVMRVTNITGASSPQTFTVVRSVNGALKTHASGAPVHVAYPVRVGL
ncbi:MAG: hypothetical protein V4515_14705 [Chloroflexota bacterium]